MHAVHPRAYVSGLVHAVLCLFSFYDFDLHYLHLHARVMTSMFFSSCNYPCHADLFLRLSYAHTQTNSLCCCLDFFCAVSVDSCLKQTGRLHGAPSWHAPWDNERLCFGLDLLIKDYSATQTSYCSARRTHVKNIALLRAKVVLIAYRVDWHPFVSAIAASTSEKKHMCCCVLLY